MTGRSRSGKISMRVRIKAKTDDRPSATMITMTVIGLRSAARISHILMVSRRRPMQDLQEILQVALRVGHAKKSSPHVQSCNGVVRFCLGEQILGFGYFRYGRQT